MSKTRKYATNWLEQPLYISMNVNLLFVINVSKLGSSGKVVLGNEAVKFQDKIPNGCWENSEKL